MNIDAIPLDVREQFFGFGVETESPTVTLRPMGTDQGDLALTYRWCNLPEVAKYMYRDHEISYQEHLDWFQSERQDHIRWIVEADGEPIGFCQIYSINRKDGIFEWGDYIALIEARGKGYGKRTKFLLHEHGFDTLGLRKAVCEVFADNQSVWLSHLKFGYRIEGYFPQHIVKGGIARDVVRVGMLAGEWKAMKSRIQASLK